ncbi:MAG: alpha/beta hydrolase family protein [Promethearchaeota archaeon]
MSTDQAKYNPFNRGPFPVGVLTQNFHDPKRNRTLPTEIWFPATNDFKNKDFDEATKDKYVMGDISSSQNAVRDADIREGVYPLIVFSHGYGNHRRLTSHLCTHLASHGYIVAAPDHLGNTFLDLLNYKSLVQKGTPPNIEELSKQIFINRPSDIKFIIDCMTSAKVEIPLKMIDVNSIGVAGYSYGGWTILMVASSDLRISAALPIASIGGNIPESTEPNPLSQALNLNWKHNIATLYLAAQKDTIVDVRSIYDMFKRTLEPKSMIVLTNGDHLHFCKEAESCHNLIHQQPELFFGDSPLTKIIKEKMLPFDKLCSAEEGHAFLQGLGLAHMDAHLKKNSNASEIFSGDIFDFMAENNVDVLHVRL